jgi:SulP family sulfate permease
MEKFTLSDYTTWALGWDSRTEFSQAVTSNCRREHPVVRMSIGFGGRPVRPLAGSTRTRHGRAVTSPRGSRVTALFPGLTQFRQYQRAWLRGDILAGLTVAAYLVPQVMAYAEVAGLPPVVGLWATIGPLAVYAVLGASRQLSIGPESTTALMTAVVLAPIAAGDPARYATLAATLALLVGGICLVARLARLGFLADLLSKPVLVGYMAGVAVIMIASQLGKITGVPVEGDEFIPQIVSFVQQLDELHWPTVVMSAVLVVMLFALAKWAPRLPGPLITVLLAALVVALFSLQDHGITVVGTVPAGLPTPAVPDLHLADLAMLLLPALGIAFVGYTDNVLTARSFAIRQGQTVDANQEWTALGAGNIAASLSQGFPISCSASRTALGAAVGSRTQLYSLVVLAVVLLTLLVAGPLLSGFPKAALGALVIFAAVRLVDIPEMRRIGRFRRSELLLTVVTTIGVLALGVLYGVLVAAALSIVDLLRRVARPHDSILGYVPGMAGMHDVDDYPQARQVPGLVVYRYDAPLCFANAEDFRRRALQSVDDAQFAEELAERGTGNGSDRHPIEWFVLNAEANVEVDITSADALGQLRDELLGRGLTFAMARVKQDLRDDLIKAGLVDKIGADLIFPTLPTAVVAYLQAYEARHGALPPGVRAITPPDDPMEPPRQLPAT